MIILCGFYNAEKYIEKCLLSIMSQSYKDFTCYITHDLSTDNSINSSEDSRMKMASISMKRRFMKCARITSNLLRSYSAT